MLTAMMEGIKNKTNPPKQTEENIYEKMSAKERKEKELHHCPAL